MGTPTQYSVLIEGNIASGKTTFIKILEQELGGKAKIFTEPLEEWTNFCGENMLKKMYEDPKANSFLFQTFVQYTMSKIQFEQAPNQIKVTERSLLSERYIFVEAIRILNHISQIEYEVLSAWYNLISAKIPPVDEIIYLKTSPLIAYGRLRGRNRTEENNVNLDYLTLLHSLHENWLTNENHGQKPYKLTIVDQDKPLKELEPEFKSIAKRLSSQLK